MKSVDSAMNKTLTPMTVSLLMGARARASSVIMLGKLSAMIQTCPGLMAPLSPKTNDGPRASVDEIDGGFQISSIVAWPTIIETLIHNRHQNRLL